MWKSSTDCVKTPNYILKYVRKTWGDFFDPVPYRTDFDPNIHPDALKIDWGRVNYINPPYSCAKPFFEKAYRLWRKDGTVSILLAKTTVLNTLYFEKVASFVELRVLNHCPIFPGYTRHARFGVALYIFGGMPGKFTVIDPR